MEDQSDAGNKHKPTQRWEVGWGKGRQMGGEEGWMMASHEQQLKTELIGGKGTSIGEGGRSGMGECAELYAGVYAGGRGRGGGYTHTHTRGGGDAEWCDELEELFRCVCVCVQVCVCLCSGAVASVSRCVCVCFHRLRKERLNRLSFQVSLPPPPGK